MSNTLALDDIRQAAARKFAPVVVTLSDGSEVELRGLIRLGKKDREIVTDRLKSLELLDDDSIDDIPDDDRQFLVDSLSEIIRVLGGTHGMRLVREIDGDLPLLIQVFETWSRESQLGEADSSPSS